MSEQSLKQQFELLQQQQKKRLTKQSKKKGEEKFCACPGDRFDNFDGVEDELNLKLSKALDFKDTDEYKDLEETIRELCDENGRLSKLIGEKDEELKIVRRRWKEDKRELAGGGFSSEKAASKIIEFSKRIRDLTSELEKEKTKSQTLKRKVDTLEQLTSPQKAQRTPTKEEKEAEANELLATKEKLTQVLLKSAEERNEIESFKKELKIAQKVLTREVGENASFLALLNSSTGWRGRQQQIIALQSKISDLQEKLAVHEGATKSRNALLNGISHHDEKHRLAMRKIELERKEHQEKMVKELEVVTEERDSYKEKNSAARARNKILTQDVKNFKEQISTLVDKGKHDDELVSALLREQQYLKEENDRLKNDKKQSAHGERILKASGNLSARTNENNEELVAKLKEDVRLQEEKVQELESELVNLKKSRNSHSDRSLVPKPPVTSNRKNEKGSRRPYSSSSTQEKEPLELQLQEIRSLLDVALVEKEKLSELTQLLQTRNEELVQDMLEKDFTLSESKNQNVKLEKRLGKLSIIQGSNVRIRGSSAGKYPNNGKPKSAEVLEEELLEAETKLSIQLDNNDALKDALSTTLKGKETDLRAFHDMVEQTKKIFLQGLRQYRQTSAS